MPTVSAPATSAVKAPAVVTTAPEKSARFSHPEAFSVSILTPNDGYQHSWVVEQLTDELDYLETPPSIVKELAPGQLFPGSVVYVAHQALVREKHPETGKFGLVRKLHVSEPIRLADYFALSKRNGGLDIDALQSKIARSLVNDPKGMFWIVRRTNDGGLKIFDN